MRFCAQSVCGSCDFIKLFVIIRHHKNQKQNIKNETIYLNAIILDNLTRFSSKIENKKLKVNTEFSEDFYIQSDNYLVSIVISNLISNAIKYSNKNGEININLVNNNNQISFSIADIGIGILPVDIDKIFNSFYRSDVTNHAEIKGTGLGLSIVKRLCDLLKLEIAVESKLNQGTTFILSFPLAKLK